MGICWGFYYVKSPTNRIKPWFLDGDLLGILVGMLPVIHYKRRDFTWH
nr:MAG TPA: hypothetical protein [Caudoviricetes sp.]